MVEKRVRFDEESFETLLTNGKIYDSLKKAADDLGFTHTNGIIRVCNGICKQTKGYKFEYYE